MADKFEYNVIHQIHHDGKPIHRGGTVVLTARAAAPLLKSGFIIKGDPEPVSDDSISATNLSKLKKEELIAHAKEVHGLELDPASTKDQLLASIAEASR
jgi:hypothetical protein